MAKPHQRAFALIAALLFLATTVAVSAAVIVQIRKDNEAQELTKQIQDQLKSSSDKYSSSSEKEGELKTTDSSNNANGGTKLEGTQLAGFTVVESVPELKIIDITVGTGDEAKADSTVTAHYTGALAKTGVIFQSSKDTGRTFTSPLSGLVKGWQQGIPGMKVGGVRRLLIPAALAYGDRAQPGIPANSDLVFDIELTGLGQ